ncbi:MAG: DUF5117 domain-containing protein, partial [Bryobacteraceae bacterium]
MSSRSILTLLLSMSLLHSQVSAPALFGQEPVPSDLAAAAMGRGGVGSGEPQAYDKVITKEAKSKLGVFTVHEIKDKYYYEIPKTEIDKEFLFVTQIARTTLGVGYGGQFLSEHVVRWERNGNKINLREVNYDVVADPKAPISLAVKAANNDAIIMTFPIAAFGKDPKAAKTETKEEGKEPETNAPEDKASDTKPGADKDSNAKAGETTPAEAKTEPNPAGSSEPEAKGPASKEAASKQASTPSPSKDASASGKDTKAAAKLPARPAPAPAYKETGREQSIVIDVTRLFTSDVFEFSARQRLNANMMDASRSYVERISPYPENIEAEATHTYSRMPTPPGLGSNQPANPFLAGGMRPGSATLVLHFSMVKLPEHPMLPRVFDERVGYFSVQQMDYSRDEQRAPKRIYITRWRLEKKDPKAEISDPVKPIVYYIDAATPSKWVP